MLLLLHLITLIETALVKHLATDISSQRNARQTETHAHQSAKWTPQIRVINYSVSFLLLMLLWRRLLLWWWHHEAIVLCRWWRWRGGRLISTSHAQICFGQTLNDNGFEICGLIRRWRGLKIKMFACRRGTYTSECVDIIHFGWVFFVDGRLRITLNYISL